MNYYPYLYFNSQNYFDSEFLDGPIKVKILWSFTLSIYAHPEDFIGQFESLEDMIDHVLNVEGETANRPTCDYDFDEMVFGRLFDFCLDYKDSIDNI